MTNDYISIFFSLFYWLSTFVLLIVLTPIITIFLVYYLSALIILICKYKHRNDPAIDALTTQAIAKFWYKLSSFWNGNEIIGIENIPDDGPALIVYYHGTFPIFMFHLWAECVRIKRRTLHSVVHHYFFRVPGWKSLIETRKYFTGSFQDCVNRLKDGNLITIAPGGEREAQFSENYCLIWNNRIGFAKVALEAKVPIIPLFTENINEAIRPIKFGQKFLRRLYERCRIPCTPSYGIFPVKLRTHIGKPIEFDPTLTPQQLAQKTALAIQDLIHKNQRIPGNILKAIQDRTAIYSGTSD